MVLLHFVSVSMKMNWKVLSWNCIILAHIQRVFGRSKHATRESWAKCNEKHDMYSLVIIVLYIYMYKCIYICIYIQIKTHETSLNHGQVPIFWWLNSRSGSAGSVVWIYRVRGHLEASLVPCTLPPLRRPSRTGRWISHEKNDDRTYKYYF